MKLSKIIEEGFVERFTHFSWVVLLIVSLIQGALWSNWANIFAIFIILISWKLITTFTIRSYIINNFSLSFFLVFGFAFTQYYLPLVFTLLEGKPVTFNLDLPYIVFIHAILDLAVIILAHIIYIVNFNKALPQLRSFLFEVKIFSPPKELQVWLMGFFGLGAMFYIYFYAPSANIEIAGTIDKLIQGLIPFSYAPFFLPLSTLYGREKKISTRLLVQLGLFFILLLIVSLGRNSRGAFMIGFASIGFSYFLGLFLNIFSPEIFTWKKIFLAIIALWLITGPLVDLGTAMVIVRGQRSKIGRTELLMKTLKIYQNKDRLKKYKSAKNKYINSSGWDVNYLDNIFFARFSNLKYNDISLQLASQVNAENKSLYTFSIDRFWASLPRPILKILGIHVNKKRVNSMSFGDYLYFSGSGSKRALGGFRSGHFAGTGMAAFSWWYLLILGIGVIPLFCLLDGLVVTAKFYMGDQKNQRITIISLVALLSITSIFMFFPTESVINIYSYLARDWLQLVFLYWLMFHITKFIANISLDPYQD